MTSFLQTLLQTAEQWRHPLAIASVDLHSAFDCVWPRLATPCPRDGGTHLLHVATLLREMLSMSAVPHLAGTCGPAFRMEREGKQGALRTHLGALGGSHMGR